MTKIGKAFAFAAAAILVATLILSMSTRREATTFRAVHTNATFDVTQPIAVTFDNMSGAATDWLAIAASGSPDNTFFEWSYTGGGSDGSLSFTNPGVGNWEVRAYFNWPSGGYTVRFRSAFSVTLLDAGPVRVSPLQSVYNTFESEAVAYTGFPGNATDWVAIASPPDAALTSFLTFQYTNGQQDGGFLFAPLTDAGTYQLRPFINNTFVPGGPFVNFTIADEGIQTVEVDRRNYPTDAAVNVSWAGLDHNPLNWVAITHADASAASWLEYIYTQGDASANYAFPPLPSGNYEARLYTNNSFNFVAVSRFEVGAPSPQVFQWNGVIGNGQSLSVGVNSGSPVDIQDAGNGWVLTDDGGNPAFQLDGAGAHYGVTSILEPARGAVAGYSDSQYPNNVAGETPHTAIANALARFVDGGFQSYHSVTGVLGQPLSVIDKEGGDGGYVGRAYPGGIQETRAFEALATTAGKSYGVGAVVLTHGEANYNDSSYWPGLERFIGDYNTDIPLITGQSSPVFLIASQQSTFALNFGLSSVQLWRLGMSRPDLVAIAGPKYQYPYAADFIHLLATGYRALGEKYAEVYKRIVVDGSTWKPLQPATVARSGAVITLNFDVPFSPLVFSTALPPNHQSVNTAWANGKGFEVSLHSSGAQLTIASAVISGNAVILTLSADPGAPVDVAYAIVQDAGINAFAGGLATGLHGLLRDSDPTVGYDVETLTVGVTNGSTAVTSSGSFLDRSLYDVVSSGGFSSQVQVKDSSSLVHLVDPWPNSTGNVAMQFHHDMYNYCVHFAVSVQ